MRRLSLALALAATLVAAAPAAAAQLATGNPCYLQRTTQPVVSLTGAGFAAGQDYYVSLDGRQLTGAVGQTDQAGTMNGTFVPPSLGPGVGEQTFDVRVTSADQSAATSFTVTRFLADFAPAKGNPRTLRVRFSLYGFGIDKNAPRPDVYLHYIRPDGRLRTTVRLGRTSGACGSLPRTALRRLFPFRAEYGTWHLQLDTKRAFVRGRNDSPFLFYTIGVKVRRVV